MNMLWANIFKSEKTTTPSVREMLRNIPIFEELNGRELQRIEHIIHEREYRTGEVIFRRDDPGVGMYVIAEGVVEIMSGPSGMHLAELGEGEFFGELSLLDDAPRTASAVAKSRCRLLCFFQPDILDLINRNPRLGVKILFRLARTIGERLRRTNDCLTAESGSPSG